MATVTGLTAERMLAIEAASVVDGDVVGDNLILTQHGGTQINAGNVRGPQGPTGPVGQDLAILTAKPVLEVGVAGQIRAGRQLTAADFTGMGLSVPLGLWNLSDLTDVSGNGRNLLNKGAVPLTAGINGVANTAAKFIGSTAQALYISDTGAADPFKIKTGSFGGWFKTAKRSLAQNLMGKYQAAGLGYFIQFGGNNFINVGVSIDGTTWVSLSGVIDIADNRWHFLVATYDGGMLRAYVDGQLDAYVPSIGGIIVPTNGPVNIGGLEATASTGTSNPTFGPADECFITGDVLSEDQIRNLYCVKVPHTLGAVPSRVSLNVRRRRKGGALVVTDFSTQPLRLHNFSAGSLGDEGSHGIGLTNQNGVLPVAGADGSAGNGAHATGGAWLFSTDAGLPSGNASRSYGCWMKSADKAGARVFMAWGGPTTAYRTCLYLSDGILTDVSGVDVLAGPYLADGKWHFVVSVHDNGATDGLRTKLYVDGRMRASGTVMGAPTLGSAFTIGADVNGTLPTIAQLDSVFVTDYAMAPEEVSKLYAKGSQALLPSPKNVGDHVEALTATDILATFDILETQHTVDIGVAV